MRTDAVVCNFFKFMFGNLHFWACSSISPFSGEDRPISRSLPLAMGLLYHYRAKLLYLYIMGCTQIALSSNDCPNIGEIISCGSYRSLQANKMF